MKLKILKNTEEPLLSRNKIEAEVEFDGAPPARKDVIAAVAEVNGVKPELVVVTKIDPKFGFHKAAVTAYSYKDEKSLDRIEEKKKLAKTGFKKPKEVAQAAPAQ